MLVTTFSIGRGRRLMTESSIDHGDLRTYATSGCEQALGHLIARHHPMVVRCAYKVLGDPAAAEDVAAAVFVRVMRKAHTLRDGQAFDAWLKSIMWNAIRDALRRRDARNRHEEAAAANKPVAIAALQPVSAEHTAQVEAALHQLSPKLRVAVTMHYYGGHSYTDMADMLGVPMRTVQTRVRRGVGKLKEALGAAGILLSVGAIESAIAAEPEWPQGYPQPTAPSVALLEASAKLAGTGSAAVWIGAHAVHVVGVAAAVLIVTLGSYSLGLWGGKIKDTHQWVSQDLPATMPVSGTKLAEQAASKTPSQPAKGAGQNAGGAAAASNQVAETGLRVRVVAADSSAPLAGVRVVACAAGSWVEGTTDAQGQVALANVDDAVLVAIDQDGWTRKLVPLGLLRQVFELSGEAAGEDGSVRVRLEPAVTLAGRVVDSNSQPLRAEITAFEIERPEALFGGEAVIRYYSPQPHKKSTYDTLDRYKAVLLPVLAHLRAAGMGPRQIQAEADGSWQVSGLALGVRQGEVLPEAAVIKMVVVSASSGALPVAVKTVTTAAYDVHGGVDRGTLALGEPLRLAEAATLRGRVVDSKGDGVPTARVRLIATRDRAAFEEPVREVAVDADGRFVVYGLALDLYTVIASSPGFAATGTQVAISRDMSEELVVLANGGMRRVTGRVVNAQGAPIEGARIWIDDPLTGNFGTRVVTTDREGGFALEDVSAASSLRVWTSRKTTSLSLVIACPLSWQNGFGFIIQLLP